MERITARITTAAATSPVPLLARPVAPGVTEGSAPAGKPAGTGERGADLGGAPNGVLWILVHDLASADW